MLIVDKNIPKKAINTLRRSLKNKKNFLFFIKVNEINKSQKNINKILDLLLKKNFSRQDCLIAVGGGITGD